MCTWGRTPGRGMGVMSPAGKHTLEHLNDESASHGQFDLQQWPCRTLQIWDLQFRLCTSESPFTLDR